MMVSWRAAVAIWLLGSVPVAAQKAPQVYGLRYALSKFPAHLAGLSTEPSETVDFGWYIFAVHEKEGWTVIDAGPGSGSTPYPLLRTITTRRLLASVGCQTVHNLVLTHAHWDHAGGVGDFPEAQVWMSRGEWDAIHRELQGPVAWRHGYRRRDLAALETLQSQGRLHLFGKSVRIGATVRAETVGGHTPGMLAILLPGEVLVGDNAYLYSNAIPAGIRRLAPRLPHLPGHDPTLLERYPTAGRDVVRLP